MCSRVKLAGKGVALGEPVHQRDQVFGLPGEAGGDGNTVPWPLKKYFPSNWLYLSECTGDMAINPTRKGGDWFDGGRYRDLHMHTWTPQTGTLRGCWDAATQSISSCNLVYATIETSQNISYP